MVTPRIFVARLAVACSLAIVTFAAAPVISAAESPAPVTPIPARPASLTLPDMPLHDPWIVADAEAGLYRLYTSNIAAVSGTPGLGTMMYASRDLKTWSPPVAVFVAPTKAWFKGGAWAPEVHPWRGRWWLFATFHDEAAALPPIGQRKPYRRGTVVAMADRPEGPFKLVRDGEPVAPKALMTLDGTLYVDPAGKPWFVYAHEWLQTADGTMEAVPVTDDLAAKGPPRVLFKASDAPWAKGDRRPSGDTVFVTDGPELFRTRTGVLLMLWSSYDANGYVQSQARSKSGTLAGPWEQLPPLVRHDSGHGMLFRRFDGQLMMIVHRPFKRARGKLYEMRDAGDRLEIIRQRIDLDGDPVERMAGP
ncbi:beta-xylosidase [Caulobacter rhizosphaerae]|uniref:Beta-xylosidase n=1 Tax=Caulobacter rhizosphaerae TaxID=2010972 RepID=A0ABU1N562_9CAUL|nr:glycoside hydrolase family 43 protein [Caulobacter rhizosphaerae]MDR6533575.1 beta-xylosidase [Caulobacter rhizosphaerae]